MYLQGGGGTVEASSVAQSSGVNNFKWTYKEEEEQ
jgi:hypothetical protein